MALLDVLTTNHTSFLREPEHFDYLRETVAPWLASRRGGPVRVWCAAASTGEEPYTLLFTLLDCLPRFGMAPDLEIVATDISQRVLDVARRGVYPAERLKGVPPAWLQQYMVRGEGEWAGHYRVKPALASRVRFTRFNLMEIPPPGWSFPVVFCRNVMIYFDRPTQTGVVGRLARCLEPGGYFFVGHAESLTGIEHPLQYVRPAVYRKAAEHRGGQR
jgi:chemotaxis protein methyltransferase CheR